MKINTKTIGAIMTSTGLLVVFASIIYLLFKLDWICGVISIGGLLTWFGGIIIGIEKETEDEDEEEQQ